MKTASSVWTFEKSTIEVETGIEETTADIEFKGMFDLQGRKIENHVKGIYIIDGKKMLVE